ncbi:MAG: DUF72 domain-containing protein [Steroidobacteraceae bacterium]|jgi:uncharacterized protein YecE (DUF72 family)|nr:DUF72 domain-containing protein [Steroidobacteraceae bacterium]
MSPGTDAHPDLFSEPAPPDRRPARAGARVDPIAPAADLTDLAARLPPNLRFGTSSWSFPGWRGLVYGADYPEATLARAGLDAYARHPLFRSVGVDRGYYAPVDEAVLARYAGAVDDDFRFLLKAHAALTTPRTAFRPAYLQGVPDLFLDARHATHAVIEPARRAMGERLGVVLFQFPPMPPQVWPHRVRLLGRLHDFLTALPPGPVYALEWRDAEILGGDYHAMLADAPAVHAPCSHPRMPPVDEQGVDPAASRALVIRWLLGHGRGYDEAREAYAPFDRLVEPDVETRQRIVDMLAAATRAGREGLVIVNNKAEGSAPLSVVELARSVLSGR